MPPRLDGLPPEVVDNICRFLAEPCSSTDYTERMLALISLGATSQFIRASVLPHQYRHLKSFWEGCPGRFISLHLLARTFMEHRHYATFTRTIEIPITSPEPTPAVFQTLKSESVQLLGLQSSQSSLVTPGQWHQMTWKVQHRFVLAFLLQLAGTYAKKIDIEVPAYFSTCSTFVTDTGAMCDDGEPWYSCTSILPPLPSVEDLVLHQLFSVGNGHFMSMIGLPDAEFDRTMVQELRYQEMGDVDLHQFRKLKTLTLTHCSLSQGDLEDCFSECPGLENFYYYDSCSHSSMFEWQATPAHIIKALVPFQKKLKSLHINLDCTFSEHWNQVSLDDQAYSIRDLSQFQALEEITFDRRAIWGSDDYCFTNLFLSTPRLRKLTITHLISWEYEGMERLALDIRAGKHTCLRDISIHVVSTEEDPAMIMYAEDQREWLLKHLAADGVDFHILETTHLEEIVKAHSKMSR